MRSLLVLLTILLFPTPVLAQDAPIFDIAARGHASVNGSYLWIGRDDGGEWNAGAAGCALTYSLPRNVAINALFDYGIPAGDSQGRLKFARIDATLKIYPIAPERSQNAIFVGVGHSWFANEDGDIGDFESNDVKLVVSRVVLPRCAVFGLYARAFTDETLADFDYAKVGLQYHLIGRED